MILEVNVSPAACLFSEMCNSLFFYRLGDNRRYEVINDLKVCAPTVVEFLKHCTVNFATNIQENVQITVKSCAASPLGFRWAP